jgi:hypothetical protein
LFSVLRYKKVRIQACIQFKQHFKGHGERHEAGQHQVLMVGLSVVQGKNKTADFVSIGVENETVRKPGSVSGLGNMDLCQQHAAS